MLHIAAKYGHKEVVSLLLDSGADINARVGFVSVTLTKRPEKFMLDEKRYVSIFWWNTTVLMVTY